MASDHWPPSDAMSAAMNDSGDRGRHGADRAGAPIRGRQPCIARQRAELLAGLAQAPWDFGFCHTLRRLDCLQPERPRIGASPRPADDPVRLGQRPSLRFAPAELAALEQPPGGLPPRLLVYFLGLLGPNGPLPAAPHGVYAGAPAPRRRPDARALPGHLPSPDALPVLPGLGPGPADGQLRPAAGGPLRLLSGDLERDWPAGLPRPRRHAGLGQAPFRRPSLLSDPPRRGARIHPGRPLGAAGAH